MLNEMSAVCTSEKTWNRYLTYSTDDVRGKGGEGWVGGGGGERWQNREGGGDNGGVQREPEVGDV